MFGTESYEQKQTFATRLLGPKNNKTRLIR